MLPAQLFIAAALLAVASAPPPARAATLETRSFTLIVSNAVVVGLSNRLAGENLVQATGQDSEWSGLHRLNQPTLRGTQARWQTNSTSTTAVEWNAKWEQPDHTVTGGMTMRLESDPATGDVLVTQAGHLATNGLIGVSWGIASVPDDVEVLVPGCSGQRFGADAPAQRRVFDYPMMWEAPFVLIQGRRGGVIIWADDMTHRFKTLVLDHSQRSFRFRFESRCTAPFENKQEITSSRWRIRAYAGNWQAGAAIYRQWAKARFALAPLAQKSPAWAAETRFVVIMGLDATLLKDLAARCNPAQTVLYLAGWREDGYDRNYPDYRTNATVTPFMAEAHRLGFRVMLHVNYFGCDPKNPAYESLKQWQIRDPLSGDLQWWEWPAKPPIKFAYINPASRAWRELFVKRMVDVIAKTGADALHLDQTLCIYNDKNGIIDGLNCIEGSLALHRELHEALPQVALSGEGLNEITSQYEHFAQRHIWSMDHVHRTWDDRQVAMSHAVSSSVLTPYTQIYGYLGMHNPDEPAMFTVWRRAYEPFGVIPTYTWPNKAQLAAPSDRAATLFELARFFQQFLPTPDFDVSWRPEDLFVYRLKGGGSARFVRDQGVAFEAQPAGQPARVLERRIERVTEARLPGSIPGWPAFDADKLIGLNPDLAYQWSAKPRDLAAPHLAALPPGYTLSRAGVHDDFARFEISRSPDAESKNTIRLWDYTGSVTGGVHLANGVVRNFGGLEFMDDESAGNAHPEGDGLFIHPPWKALPPAAAGAGNTTFLDYPLTLPNSPSVRFTSEVRLASGAGDRSDGVTFKVIASCGIEERRAALHHASEKPVAIDLDLSAWRGKPIVLRLEADPGPKDSPAYDWGRFVRPRITAQDSAVATQQSVTLAGFRKPARVLVAEGEARTITLLPKADQAPACQVTCQLPNTLIVSITNPDSVALPCKLLQRRFASRTTLRDGLEQTASGLSAATVTSAKRGDTTRPALRLNPPSGSKSFADWWLTLPATPCKLVAAIGIPEGAKSTSVAFAVEVNGRIAFARVLHADAGWTPVEINLSDWKGQPVVLTLLTDASNESSSPLAAWAEPQLLPRPE